jgi:hypothetical protein
MKVLDKGAYKKGDQVTVYIDGGVRKPGIIESINSAAQGSKGTVRIEGFRAPVPCGYHPENGWYVLED